MREGKRERRDNWVRVEQKEGVKVGGDGDAMAIEKWKVRVSKVSENEGGDRKRGREREITEVS